MNKRGTETKECEIEFSIPITGFSNRLSPLETVVIYLRERYGLRFSQIGNLIGRDERNTATAYRTACRRTKKEKGELLITYNENYNENDNERLKVPIRLFRNRELSILEHVVYFLNSKGIGNYQISKLLNKDPSTIYTVMNRALVKKRKEIQTEKINTSELQKKKLFDISKIEDRISEKKNEVINYLREKHKLNTAEISKILNLKEEEIVLILETKNRNGNDIKNSNMKNNSMIREDKK